MSNDFPKWSRSWWWSFIDRFEAEGRWKHSTSATNAVAVALNWWTIKRLVLFINQRRLQDTILLMHAVWFDDDSSNQFLHQTMYQLRSSIVIKLRRMIYTARNQYICKQHSKRRQVCRISDTLSYLVSEQRRVAAMMSLLRVMILVVGIEITVYINY